MFVLSQYKRACDGNNGIELKKAQNSICKDHFVLKSKKLLYFDQNG